MKNVFDLTKEEFDKIQIPHNNKIGKYSSINGKYLIEFKTDKPKGSAGLAHTFEFFVNGEKMIAPFTKARKYLFELPDDFNYWITYDGIKEYAKENNL